MQPYIVRHVASLLDRIANGICRTEYLPNGQVDYVLYTNRGVPQRFSAHLMTGLDRVHLAVDGNCIYDIGRLKVLVLRLVQTGQPIYLSFNNVIVRWQVAVG